MKSPLYVRRIVLKNIRCFRQLEIDFGSRESIVIIGDNAEGKSSLLRSLAMGLCDESSAAALFRELHGEFVRTEGRETSGAIEVELGGKGGVRYRSETYIKSLKNFERVEQKLYRLVGSRKLVVSQDDFPWDRIFTSAYGAGIRVQGTADFDYYLAADAVYPLFRYDTQLQNPELVARRLVAAAEQRGGTRAGTKLLREVTNLLGLLLQLAPGEKVELEPRGIFVSDANGKHPLSALADGYRGTVTWVLDLIAWWFVRVQDEGLMSLTDVRGVVLVDELEQHLHPQWQRNIMGLLHEAFPEVQFVVTTHAPLVASGTEGVSVYRLMRGDATVAHPFGWTAEDVYEWMGLDDGSRSPAFRARVLDRLRELDLKQLSGTATRDELRELRDLQTRVEELLPNTDPLQSLVALESIRNLLEGPPG